MQIILLLLLLFLIALPALAQVSLMGRVLRGEAIGAADLALPLAVAAVLTALCLADVARRMRLAVLR